MDLWALGCFAFETLHGVCPFKGDSLDTLNLRIKKVDHAPFRPSVSAEARRLIKMLLVAEPMERVAAEDAGRLWSDLHSTLLREARGGVKAHGGGAEAQPPAAGPSA